MATRFGGVVKGAVEALDGRSFLSWKLGETAALGSVLGAEIPVALMTSFQTDRETRAHVASLGVAEPLWFTQSVSLRLTEGGGLFLESGRPSPYAPGHGDLVATIRSSGTLDALRARGVEHALLNAGGDTRVIGDRRGQPWIVGIRHPRVAGEVVTKLPLVDEAISTSGDYERFFEENGRRYHHIIDPATGRPTEGILTVTVIGPDGTMTDGLDTAIFVLGVEKGLALIEAYPEYETIIVDAAGKLFHSEGLLEQ